MILKSLIAASILISTSFSLELVDIAKEDSYPLSIKKAIDISIKNDPWLEGNKLSQKSLDLKSISSGTLPDPKITLSAANLPTDTFKTNQEAMTQYKIGISQMFPRGDSLEIKQNQIKLEASQFPFQRENRKAQIAIVVGKLWFDIFKVQETIELIEKNKYLFEQLVGIAESNYSSAKGKTLQQDIVRAQLQLTNIDNRLTKLYQQNEVLKEQLSQWLYDSTSFQTQGKISLFSINISGNLPHMKILNEQILNLVNDDAILNYFLEHPSIKSIEQKIKATQKSIDLAKEKYKPEFGVNASYGYREDAINGSERADLVSVGVSFDLPLFTNDRQDKDYHAAILKTKSVEVEKTLKLRELLSLFKAKKVNLKRLQDRQVIYDKKILPQVSELAETSLTAYTNDNGNFSDVILARISELDAKIEALDIYVEIEKNKLELDYTLIKDASELLQLVESKGD